MTKVQHVPLSILKTKNSDCLLTENALAFGSRTRSTMGHVVRLTGARAQVENPRRAIDRGRSTSMLARVSRQVDAREAHVARDH